MDCSLDCEHILQVSGMCVTDRHGMTFAVKVVLNPNTTNYNQLNIFSNNTDIIKCQKQKSHKSKMGHSSEKKKNEF